MNTENFFNGNENLSPKEINPLEKANEYKKIVENLNPEQLNELKININSQMEKYKKENNILESIKYISLIAKKIIDKINQIIIKDLENLESEFPSIENVEELKKLVEQKLISSETEIFQVYGGTKFFEDIQNAQNYSIKSAQEGIKKSKNGKINYGAIGYYAQNTIDKEKSPNITKLIAAAQYFMGAKENGKNKLSQQLKERMKNLFGLNDIRQTPWCAAYIGDCLIRAGYFKNVQDLKNHVPNPLSASSYLGLGPFPGHIGIYTGGDTIINGNYKNSVRYSKVKWNKLVGWVMPEDLGDPSKVHFYQKEKKKPPVGALLVFKRGKLPLPKHIAEKTGMN